MENMIDGRCSWGHSPPWTSRLFLVDSCHFCGFTDDVDDACMIWLHYISMEINSN